jgi:integrase
MKKRVPPLPFEDAVAEALKRFDAPDVQETWETAISRRSTDAKGALTSARELLESVCKHILDDADISYDDLDRLNQLYHLTATTLQIAPSQHSEAEFKRILGACKVIVEGLGNLRTDLGDAHGRGRNAPRADLTHAELAVNLAGVVATYLIRAWEARQHTIGELIDEYLQAKGTGGTAGLMLNAFRRGDPLANMPARRLTAKDVVAYARRRRLQKGMRQKSVGQSTARQSLSFLKYVFEYGRKTYGLEEPLIQFDLGVKACGEAKLVGKAEVRERVPTQEEIDRFLAFFEESDKRSTVIRMLPIVEFAIETARTLGEICALRWRDVSLERHTYRIPDYKPGRAKLGRDAQFPLNAKASAVVSRLWKGQRPDELVFSAKFKSVSQTFGRGIKALEIKDLVFNDLRTLAIIRLFERGFVFPEVQQRAGILSADTMDRYWQLHLKRAVPNLSDAGAPSTRPPAAPKEPPTA